MNQPIGHDINGRPLRVGDEVVIVACARLHWMIGTISQVIGVSLISGNAVLSEENEAGMNYEASPRFLRKLHDDHRPANESFGDMISALVGNKRVGAYNESV